MNGSQPTWASKWVWRSTKPGRDGQAGGVDLLDGGLGVGEVADRR